MKGMGWTPMSQKKRVAMTHTIGTHVKLQNNTSLVVRASWDLCLCYCSTADRVCPSFHYYPILHIITCRDW